jgi:hypothetical protein
MKQKDKILKEVLKLKMEKLDDKSFTGRIVDLHLRLKEEKVIAPAFDFLSLIFGLISALICIGLALLLISDVNIGLSSQNIMILFLVSIIYLIYRLLNEIFTPCVHC